MSPVSGRGQVVPVPLVLTPRERRDHELPQQGVHPCCPRIPGLQPQRPQHDPQHGLTLLTVIRVRERHHIGAVSHDIMTQELDKVTLNDHFLSSVRQSPFQMRI